MTIGVSKSFLKPDLTPIRLYLKT